MFLEKLEDYANDLGNHFPSLIPYCHNYIENHVSNEDLPLESSVDIFKKIVSSIFSKDDMQIINNYIPELLISIYTSCYYHSLEDNKTRNGIIDDCFKKDPTMVHKSTFYDICKRLNSIYKNGQSIYFSQSRKNDDILYFKDVWSNAFSSSESDEAMASRTKGYKKFRVFDSLDFYIYITEYKRWPQFFSNRNGMLFMDLFSSMKSMFALIMKNHPKADFDQMLSLYFFERLFYPQRFINTLTSYFEYFGDIVSMPDSPERERAILFSSVYGSLPVSIQKNYKDNYFNSLRNYIISNHKNDESSNRSGSFIKQLWELLNIQYYTIPVCERIFAYILLNLKATQEEYYNKELLTSIKNYCDKEFETPDTFTKSFNSAIDKISRTVYPGLKDKNKAVKIDAFHRNNNTCNSFEVNFTYFFYSSTPGFDYFDECKRSRCIIAPKPFIEQKIQNLFISSNNILNFKTSNFRKYNNPDAIIFPIIDTP